MTETAVPPSPVPVRERGYQVDSVGTRWWAQDVTQETTPELRWPHSIAVYNAMWRQDAQVSSVLRAVSSPILRTRWAIDGTGCDPRVVQHVATDLGLPIVGSDGSVASVRTKGRFSWQRHLREALLFLRYGHAFFEQVYRLDGAGQAHLRKLGYRPPHTIAKINVARDGGLVSIEQNGFDGAVGSVTLPVARLVAYVLEQEGGDWTGTSLLRPAYKHWLLKDRLLRVQTQSVERNGMGIPLYTAAPGETDLDAGEEIATSVRAGDNSGAAIPNGADLELLGVTGALPDADKPIRYHDEQIARAVLAHVLNLGQATGTGSYALGDTLAGVLEVSLQAVAEQVRDTSSAHIVEDLVDINYGPDEPAPRLVFDEIGSNSNAIVMAIAQLVNAGVLRPDEDLEQFLRTTLGLPPFGGSPLTAPTPQERS